MPFDDGALSPSGRRNELFQILRDWDTMEDWCSQELGDVMKINGTELSTTHLKEDGIPLPRRWWDRFKETGQCFVEV